MAIGRSSGNAWRSAGVLASQQDGHLNTEQLSALGFAAADLSRAVAGGRLVRVHTSVYASGHVRKELRARWHAAVLATSPDCRLAHRSALEALRLLAPIGGPVHVSVPRGRRFARSGLVIHRPVVLDEKDLTMIDGLPVTAAARALVESSATVPRVMLERAVHEALVLGLTSVEEVLDRLDSQTRRPGAPALRRALGQDVLDLRSRGERAFLAICRTMAVPAPRVNALLDVPWGQIRPDFCWPDLRLIVEIDGRMPHGTALAFAADRRRDRRLRIIGWDVARFPADEVIDNPEGASSDLCELISAARRRHSSA